MSQWLKTPKANGYYWYQDQHNEYEENLHIIAHVTIVGEKDWNIIVAINGEVYGLDDLRDDLPWFLGPIEVPSEPCPGGDGYYTKREGSGFVRFTMEDE